MGDTRVPAVGDPVFLDGAENFTITEFPTDSRGNDRGIVRFDAPRKHVKCNKAKLVWLDDVGAWTLPGRLLAPIQKAEYARANGGTPPRADQHLSILRALRTGADLKGV